MNKRGILPIGAFVVKRGDATIYRIVDVIGDVNYTLTDSLRRHGCLTCHVALQVDVIAVPDEWREREAMQLREANADKIRFLSGEEG